MSPLQQAALVAVVASLGASHLWAILQRRWPALSVHLALDVLALLWIWVGYHHPDTFEAWGYEDHWVEWGTVFAYLVAVPLAVGLAWRTRGWARAYWLGIAAFGLFVAGEEVSWGQRIFNIAPPEVFLQRNFQQELNVHNFISRKTLFGVRLESGNLLILICLVYGILGSHLGRLPRLRRIAPLAALAKHSPPPFLAPWFGAIVAGQLIYPLDFTGEYCEYSLGLLFLIHALLAGRLSDASDPTPMRRVWWALEPPAWIGSTALQGWLMPIVLGALLYGPNPKAEEEARADIDALIRDFQRQGVVQQSAWNGGVLGKRIYTAVLQGYIRFGNRSEFLGPYSTPAESATTSQRRKDRKGYFLDPWNNSFWMYFEPGTGRVIIYSFGRNGRRDCDVSRLVSLPEIGFCGDDIGAIAEVPQEP